MYIKIITINFNKRLDNTCAHNTVEKLKLNISTYMYNISTSVCLGHVYLVA